MGPSIPDAHETSEPINAKPSNEDQPRPDAAKSPIADDDRDDFGLPSPAVRKRAPPPLEDDRSGDGNVDNFHDADEGDTTKGEHLQTIEKPSSSAVPEGGHITNGAEQKPSPSNAPEPTPNSNSDHTDNRANTEPLDTRDVSKESNKDNTNTNVPSGSTLPQHETGAGESSQKEDIQKEQDASLQRASSTKKHTKDNSVSEWSHQRLAPREEGPNDEDEDEWQAMPAVAEYDLYDDWGKLIAKGVPEEDAEEAAYGGLGGAGKGYTRVQLDEDAQSATSMDEDTQYLFKEAGRNDLHVDDEQRDAMSQLEATKDLLTEGQRIAYVGVTRLTIYKMAQELEKADTSKSTKKDFAKALESTTKWGQQMMVRLYGHMDIDSAEQVMIEQLAEHGVQPEDLVPPLMQHARVQNPMADVKSPRPSVSSTTTKVNGDDPGQSLASPRPDSTHVSDDGDVPRVHTPSQMTHDAKIDLDLRWTVLCDLFLVLIADSSYDARSRQLLERVGAAMDVAWVQICRFEKRVIDALEMQEEKDKENWNEDDHVESRRKKGLKRKYMVMGLATVGGGLVIGLSAGLLAPVIGAGLAAGFTTIGVTGTAGFLGGVGGAALITSAATAAGGTIAVRASDRRTGHVKTFEYRPLHNNKRLNLILTVSGWMSGKVDDVRLPYSTVDPIMGDIYSLLWEPEMLQSMGDTINILATEALTQTVQQVLGSTILVALMASIQLPVVLTKLSYLIDNPWSVSLDRANAAGLILADSLIDRHLGSRPVTLVGFSLGSRVVFSCLRELANKGAYGLVQNVYLFGSPIVAKRDEYLRARTAVAGRFVNGYASNDWILGYLFRATSGGIMGIAGLAPVKDVPGIENLDVTSMVNGHMAYRTAMPRLLREVGWEVESDEFTEIEDPDPENHAARQRELIREIEEARKDAEEKPEKKRFGFFKKGKMAKKKGWETYDQDTAAKQEDSMHAGSSEPNVLYDIEAIKRELESEFIEVKQLESTLPPMKLDLNGSSSIPKSPREMLRHTQSSEATLHSQPSQPEQVFHALPTRSKDADTSPAPATPLTHEASPNPPFLASPSPSFGHSGTDRVSFSSDHDYQSPRELKSTLPPMRYQQTPSPRESSPLGRPELKSHATMPVNGTSYSLFPTAGVERNAWADEDEDFGKEQDISMTFE